MTAAAMSSSSGPNVLARVIPAGLAGAFIDFAYATTVGAISGRGFAKVWQGVAGGWLGKSAGQGGAATVALGLVTHVGIATCMAGAYALIATRAPVLYRRPVLTGALYGLALYGVMYRVVLPLRWPAIFPRWDGGRSVADIGVHIGVGLAIALVLSGRLGPKPRD